MKKEKKTQKTRITVWVAGEQVVGGSPENRTLCVVGGLPENRTVWVPRGSPEIETRRTGRERGATRFRSRAGWVAGDRDATEGERERCDGG
jgi:hypothetical protein